ncbi:DUF938 domain-containing protein [Ferrimonas balearica]|uniref:DUF938 domain-containing protein n=1 Tax=Ferrimonas balearica TaxID=44012 RepID=UPI001C99EBF2|nr:DUF938 domain-containing protein [Ferrimonas balearica]MBY5993899.1 DUF938 domain-containing protein [Ferrimonas balearica]
MTKPFSQACENNRAPILSVLKAAFADTRRVLEIGSGTGQHGVHFAPQLDQLIWQMSDRAENLPGIEQWRRECGVSNLPPAIELDVTRAWPAMAVDGVFSANTAHIMAWPVVEAMMAGIGQVLRPGGCFCLYGPFHYGGQPTSASNARFDAYLRSEAPQMGIRDIEAVTALARAQGMTLEADHPMPANNRLLQWRRLSLS